MFLLLEKQKLPTKIIKKKQQTTNNNTYEEMKSKKFKNRKIITNWKNK